MLTLIKAIANGVLISRVKTVPEPQGNGHVKPFGWQSEAAFKVCVTIGHSRKEVEKAGSVVRQAVGKVVGRLKKENRFLS